MLLKVALWWIRRRGWGVIPPPVARPGDPLYLARGK